jgi:hypothetical protein
MKRQWKTIRLLHHMFHGASFCKLPLERLSSPVDWQRLVSDKGRQSPSERP